MHKMKLNQVIAVVNGKKTHAQNTLAEIHHKVMKTDLSSGLIRTYNPTEENGETLPAEQKKVQYTAQTAIEEVKGALSSMFDLIHAQDDANCVAKADIVVDDQKILTNVPVTHLLFLDKQLKDLTTFVEKLPVLDPSDSWDMDTATGLYKSRETRQKRTRKVMKNHVKAEATEKHPAQVDVFTEDVPVGEWATTKLSGAIPATEKAEMTTRVRKLLDAVKVARETANEVQVEVKKVSDPIFNYIFQSAD